MTNATLITLCGFNLLLLLLLQGLIKWPQNTFCYEVIKEQSCESYPQHYFHLDWWGPPCYRLGYHAPAFFMLSIRAGKLMDLSRITMNKKGIFTEVKLMLMGKMKQFWSVGSFLKKPAPHFSVGTYVNVHLISMPFSSSVFFVWLPTEGKFCFISVLFSYIKDKPRIADYFRLMN